MSQYMNNVTTGTDCVSGFVRAEGQRIVNGEGVPFLLRGVGLGSWLLPEGYMWRMPEAADRPRRMEAMVRSLLGTDGASRFWETYWDRFITEKDVERIASEGFNSLRVPINARYLTGTDASSDMAESRLQRIDRLLEWCKTHRVYAILDLHGTPGGQTGTNIDDSAHDRPDLFTESENQDHTVQIWRSLAQRYKDEWIVAGFDLLNEPLPEWFSRYNDRVMPLYRRITQAIREVDRRHMIILEGVHWATDWSIFTDLGDDNVMLQFHKYWNNPDRESLTPYLEARDRLNVPIFMGEGGENNTDWYTGAFRLFEDLNISWNFWTWKKLDTTNSPASIRLPAGWNEVVAYADGGGGDRPAVAPPALECARTALADFLDNLPLQRCDYHDDVVRSLFRRPPLRIPAIFYAFQDRGRGYDLARNDRDTDAGTRAATEATPTAKHAPHDTSEIEFRAGDGTEFGYVTGHQPEAGAPNFQHNGGEPWAPEEWLYLQLNPGSWAAYDFAVAGNEEQQLHVGVRLACGAQSDAPTVTITIDRPAHEITVPVTAQQTDFSDYWVQMSAEPGLRRVVIRSDTALIQLEAVYVTIGGGGGTTFAPYGVTDSDSAS
ncbi:MAG: cellulase family glycosylhydrolase [Spirochaeta sp.]|jgi:endoglucanase|nr:cellulase family glycosylhydrolase [Spirochaeta sp.]